jgi:hypothetical protein
MQSRDSSCGRRAQSERRRTKLKFERAAGSSSSSRISPRAGPGERGERPGRRTKRTTLYRPSRLKHLQSVVGEMQTSRNETGRW